MRPDNASMGTGEGASLRINIVRADAAQARSGSQPTVSIVVPVFNGARFVGQSIDSILVQTYRPHEVIVMDDGSTDETPDIVASYGDAVRYVRQPSTRGIYGNANDGIALATGELIGVFHADDVYLPEMLEREVAWLERHPQAAVVFCSDIFIDPEGRELAKLELPPDVRGSKPLDYAAVLNALLRYTNVFLRTPTALVRASVYRELGVYRDEEFKNTAELDMWLRIARRYAMGTLEDHLILRRRGHGSSAERYHRVRTDPFRFFTIMDRELDTGGRAVAVADALQAYEAHRAVDNVLRSANHYTLGNRNAAGAVLRDVHLRDLIASRRIQRARMLVLALVLKVLVRLPRIAAVGRLFERHWYGQPSPGGSR
jgi:GT2 family glycosyltransferase